MSMHMLGTRDNLRQGFLFDVLRELPTLRRYARTLTWSNFDCQHLVHNTLVTHTKSARLVAVWSYE